jgi:hypothetical protein
MITEDRRALLGEIHRLFLTFGAQGDTHSKAQYMLMTRIQLLSQRFTALPGQQMVPVLMVSPSKKGERQAA